MSKAETYGFTVGIANSTPQGYGAPRVPNNYGDDKGHSRRDCSAVVCTRCEDIGHESSTCKKPPPTCPDCGGAHKQHRCPRKHQDERAPRPRRSFVKINPDFRSGARALTQEEQSRKDDFAALRALEPHGNTASPDGYDVDASESADDGKISDLIAASDGKTPEWDYATSTYSTYEWEWVLAEMMMRSRLRWPGPLRDRFALNSVRYKTAAIELVNIASSKVDIFVWHAGRICPTRKQLGPGTLTSWSLDEAARMPERLPAIMFSKFVDEGPGHHLRPPERRQPNAPPRVQRIHYVPPTLQSSSPRPSCRMGA
ncbi:hypothetical protein ACJZ2D_011060 [Fusarium nematophilum]